MLTNDDLDAIEEHARKQKPPYGVEDVVALVGELRAERAETEKLREEIAAKDATVAELQHWIGASM